MEALRPDLVSIIVPVFNAEAFLDRCVGSVLAQDYAALELILVDDGSTDGSPQMCDAYAEKDPRVTVAHKSNGGPSAARNAGLDRSRGEFLYFLDADDEMTPDALSVLVDLMRDQEADWVAGGFCKQRQDGGGAEVLFSGGRVAGHAGILACARNYLHRPNRYELFSYSWGRLYRNEIVHTHDIRYSERLFTYEDVEFNFRYLMHAGVIFTSDRSLYIHHVHDNYTSSRTMFGSDPMRLMGHIEMLDTLRAFAEQGEGDLPAEVDADIKHALIYLSIIQFVRLCGRLNWATFTPIRTTISRVIRDPRLRAALPFYRPLPGDSRWLPRLMRWRLATLAVLLSYYKAYRRYRLQQAQPNR